MVAIGHQRAQTTGPWLPSHQPLQRRAEFARHGYDTLDEKCKTALQQLLKPSRYEAIDPWIQSASTSEKRSIFKLAAAAVGDHGMATEQGKAYRELREDVQKNPKGRMKLSGAMQVTGDRLQHDMWRAKSREKQRDPKAKASRELMRTFMEVPSEECVSAFYRLGSHPVATDIAVSALCDRARQGLAQWQVRAPEKNGQRAAEVMQALRSLNSVVVNMPVYTDHHHDGLPNGSSTSLGLYDYWAAKEATRFRAELKLPPERSIRANPRVSTAPLPRARSTPAMYVRPQELENIQKPGGYVVRITDPEPLQMLKNRKRNTMSRVHQGGSVRWATTYDTMMTAPS